MKPSIYRRIRRRTSSHEAVNSKKENKQESSFFGEAATEHFFQPASVVTQTPVINRKCADCEQEDKKVQRAEDKKEEDKLQRQPEKNEEKLMKKSDEKEEEKIQKKEAGNPTSTPVTSSYISSLSSKGTALPKQAQQFFGSRMGYDFSNVKVHADQEAAQSANEVNAKAYTTGAHIVFNEGQYDTESTEGKKLMAHELTHVVQNNSETILRTPRETSTPVRAATVDEQREFVGDTIHFFEMSRDFYTEPRVRMDAAIFERVIQSWYVMIVESERIIANQLNNDVLLLRSLKTAYRAAINALISRAATALGVSEAELFNRNNGRIPLWAWQTPHHNELGFTMPIPEGHSPDIISGNVEMSFPNLSVSILPDDTDSTLTTPGATRILFNRGAINWVDVNGIATNVTGPGTTTCTIQTLYRPGVNPNDASGYGRGTTQEDIRGGAVDRRSTTLGFHEANHGLDFLDFIRTHTFPVFTGSSGMPVAQIQTLAAQWIAAVQQYNTDINLYTSQRTHCVGTTIDQFNQAQSAGTGGVTLECPVP